MTDGHLSHYGIKGMQWGVRRKRNSNGSVKKSTKNKQSSDFKSTKDLRKRPPQALSNMQLKKINERVQLETKFSQMNPTRMAKGKEAAGNILKFTTGAAGAAGIRELATNPKYARATKRGATIVRANAKTATAKIARKIATKQSLQTQVRKGLYG